MNTLISITKGLLNLAYPQHCALCLKPLEPARTTCVCESCFSQIKRNPEPHCPLCGRPIEDAKSSCCPECKKTTFCFERAYSACLYEGVLRDLIHLFKYKGRLSLAQPLSGLMADYVRDNPCILKDIDGITFVPIHSSRMRQREFNQSRTLAMKLSEKFGLPLYDYLYKSTRTRSQNELSRNERFTNVRDSFSLRSYAEIAGQSFLLIDDVMTTGATLNECARILLRSGARRVRCLTLARGA